jgi:hypothetical protein
MYIVVLLDNCRGSSTVVSMTELSIQIRPRHPPTDGPACHHCGSPTRLFGLEPHPTVDRTDLRTYVCEACGEVQTEIIPFMQ